MQLRQEGGEIAPATWLGGAVTAVTLGGVVLLAERWVGTAPAFIIFWLGCAVAALCLFGAGRQHYINVGQQKAALTAEPPTATDATLLPPPPQQTARAQLDFVGSSVNEPLSAFRDGYARWEPSHGRPRDIQYAALASFRSRDVSAMVSAALTFVNNGTGEVTQIHAGCWLAEETNKVGFGRVETKHLIVVAQNGFARRNVVPQDDRRFPAAHGIVLRDLPDGEYTVAVELLIDDDHDDVQRVTLHFSLRIRATEPTATLLAILS